MLCFRGSCSPAIPWFQDSITSSISSVVLEKCVWFFFGGGVGWCVSCERRKTDEVRRPWKERKRSSPPASSSDSEDAALGNLDRGTAVGKRLWAVLRCVRACVREWDFRNNDWCVAALHTRWRYVVTSRNVKERHYLSRSFPFFFFFLFPVWTGATHHMETSHCLCF